MADMAWRKPELRDIAAKLNQRELDAYRQHPDFVSAADPVADLLEMTAESVRGFCRSNRQIRMSPAAGSIPEGLMAFAMDIAAYDVLTRINVKVSDDRKAKWEKALEWMEKAANGSFTPESWGGDGGEDGDTASNRAEPAFGAQRYKRLNEEI